MGWWAYLAVECREAVCREAVRQAGERVAPVAVAVAVAVKAALYRPTQLTNRSQRVKFQYPLPP